MNITQRFFITLLWVWCCVISSVSAVALAVTLPPGHPVLAASITGAAFLSMLGAFLFSSRIVR